MPMLPEPGIRISMSGIRPSKSWLSNYKTGNSSAVSGLKTLPRVMTHAEDEPSHSSDMESSASAANLLEVQPEILHQRLGRVASRPARHTAARMRAASCHV